MPLAGEDRVKLQSLQEWIAGTDPTDGESCFEVGNVTATGAVVTVRWLGAPGRWYAIQRNQDLTDPEGWTRVHGPTQNGPEYRWMEWTDPESSALGAACYRLEVFGP